MGEKPAPGVGAFSPVGLDGTGSGTTPARAGSATLRAVALDRSSTGRRDRRARHSPNLEVPGRGVLRAWPDGGSSPAFGGGQAWSEATAVSFSALADRALDLPEQRKIPLKLRST